MFLSRVPPLIEVMKSNNPAPQTGPKKHTPIPEFTLPDLKHYLMVIRERFFLAAFGAIVVVGLVGYYFLSDPPVYRTASVLQIEMGQPRVVDMEGVVEPDGMDRRDGGAQLIATHMQQLRSRAFINRVVESFDEEERADMVAAYIDNSNPDEPVVPSLGGVIRSNFSAMRREGTMFLELTVGHRDPDAAARIANRIAEEYIEYLVEYSDAGNVSAIRFLQEQAASLRQEVETGERELQQYRTEHDLVSLEENQNIVVARLQQLNDSLTGARVERIDLDSRLEQVERYKEEGRDLLEIEAIAGYGSLPRLKERLEDLESERDVMSERYLERHPAMLENERSMAVVARQIESNIEQALSELRARQSNAHEREARLRSELAQAERESLELDLLRVDYRVKERELATVRDTYSRILRRLDEATVTSQLENRNIRVFETASRPGSPSEPNVPRVAMILIFLGGMVFVGLPVGLDALNSRVRSWADVENYLGRRVLGEIPRVKRIKRAFRARIVDRELNDPVVIESFRSLYNQIGFASHHEGAKVMLVSGTAQREGKTFVTCNLAATFAAHGKKTLVIDGDLRGPSIHVEFGLDNKAGLMKFLQGGESCEGEPLKKTDLGITAISGNLYILPSGGHSRKPTEIFEDVSARAFFKWIRGYFDVILIDSPPLAVFPDALNLVHYSDEVVYVCRFNGVNREEVKSYVDGFDETDAEILGLVMNEMPTGRAASQYYSGRGYYSHKAYSKYYANKA